MRHLPITSHTSQITRPHDVEYIVLPGAEDTNANTIWDYIRILRNRKWLFLMPFLIVLPSLLLYIVLAKTIYRTSATLLIEKANPNVIAIEEVVSPEQSSDSPDFFRTQYEIIRSPLVLEKVVDAFQIAEPDVDAFQIAEPLESEVPHILREISIVKSFLWQSFAEIRDKYPFFSMLIPAQTPPSTEELRQKAVQNLRDQLDVKPKSGTQLVDLILKGSDPTGIIQRVNMIADVYMKQNLDNKMDASIKAIEWLTQREAELKTKISRLETELRLYKENKKIVSLDEFAGSRNPAMDRMNSFQSPLISIIEQKERLENEIKSIRALSKKDIEYMLGTMPDMLNSFSIKSLNTMYSELNMKLQDLSKIYGKKHYEIIRVNSQISELESLIHEEIDKKLYTMENQYRQLVSLEKMFENRVEQERKDFNQLSSDIQRYNDLNSELAIDKELLLTVSKRLAETTLTGVLETNNVRTIQKASVAEEAAPYLKKFMLIAGILISLSLGAGLAFMAEHFDKRFRSVEEAEQYLGIALLGIVPHYQTRNSRLVALYNPQLNASEAYRTLRTWIRLSSPNSIKTLLITSALAGEGKSQTAGNLAISFAQLGQKVLLIDADLRRPQVHRTFNLTNSEGLRDVLGQGVEWQSVLQATAMENLKVLLTGGRPHNPTELLSTMRMQSLLASVKDEFDLIIVDAPVMLSIPDVAILIPDMDGVLLVHDPTKGSREVVLEAKRLLDKAGAKLLGMIFNNISFKKQIRYQHTSEYYQSAYSQDRQKRWQKNGDVPVVDMRPIESQRGEEIDT